MGGRSGRGIRSPIGYASGYQNSYSDAEITVRATALIKAISKSSPILDIVFAYWHFDCEI